MSAHADATGKRSTYKPRVRPGLLGFVCYSQGVVGHGMTVEAAYASWRQRIEWPMVQRWTAVHEALEREWIGPVTARCMTLLRKHFDPDTVQSDLGTPFSHEPL